MTTNAAIIFAAVALLVGGCQQKSTPPLVRVGVALDGIEAHRARADASLTKVLPAATGPVRDGVVAAKSELSPTAMGARIADARRATIDATGEVARVTAKLKWYENSRVIQAVVWIMWMFKFLAVGGVITVALAFALRAWAGASGGPIVKAASGILWGVISFGLAPLKTLAGRVGEKSAGKKRVVLPEATANIAVAKAQEIQTAKVATAPKVG